MTDEEFYNNFKTIGLILRIIGVILIVVVLLIQLAVIEFPESFHIENDGIYWNLIIICVMIMIIVGIIFIIYGTYGINELAKNIKKNDVISL